MAESFRRKSLFHQPPNWVKDGKVFFVTICCSKKGENTLCHPSVADRIFESVDLYNTKTKWRCSLMVLMPDHLHALLCFPSVESITRIISAWKAYHKRTAGIQWQKDYFDHRIRSNESRDEKAAYIRMNPVRNGLVATPEDWPFIREWA